MLNLLMQQIMALLKANGFDGEQAQAQIRQAVDDIRAMKESQDRCETMLKALSAPGFNPGVGGRPPDRSPGVTENRFPITIEEKETVQ